MGDDGSSMSAAASQAGDIEASLLSSLSSESGSEGLSSDDLFSLENIQAEPGFPKTGDTEYQKIANSLTFSLALCERDPRLQKFMSIHSPSILKHIHKKNFWMTVLMDSTHIPFLGPFIHAGRGLKSLSDLSQLKKVMRTEEVTTTPTEGVDAAVAKEARDKIAQGAKKGLIIDFIVNEVKFGINVTVNTAAMVASHTGALSGLPLVFILNDAVTSFIAKATLKALCNAATTAAKMSISSAAHSRSPGYMVALLRYVMLPVRSWEMQLAALNHDMHEQIKFLENNMTVCSTTFKEFDTVASIVKKYGLTGTTLLSSADLALPYSKLSSAKQRTLKNAVMGRLGVNTDISTKEQKSLSQALKSLKAKADKIKNTSKLVDIMDDRTFKQWLENFGDDIPQGVSPKAATLENLPTDGAREIAKGWALAKDFPSLQCAIRIKLRLIFGLKESEHTKGEKEICDKSNMHMAKNMLTDPLPWEGGYEEWRKALKQANAQNRPIMIPYIHFLLFIYRVYYKLKLKTAIEVNGGGFTGLLSVLSGRFRYGVRGVHAAKGAASRCLELSASMPAVCSEPWSEEELQNFFAPERYAEFMCMPVDELLTMRFGSRLTDAARDSRTAVLGACGVARVRDLARLSERKMEVHRFPVGLRLLVRELQDLDLHRSMFLQSAAPAGRPQNLQRPLWSSEV